MSQTEQILDRFVESQGWTQGTVLDLALTYIENQASPEAWEDYLTSLAEVDDDIDPRDIEETTQCRHCGHGIGLDGDTWVAPDAGFDVENGDGIWRDSCPDNHESREAPHEPVTEHDHRCVHCGQILKPERDKGLLVDERTGDWWCRANPSNGGDAAPHEVEIEIDLSDVESFPCKGCGVNLVGYKPDHNGILTCPICGTTAAV